jgi:hypothetical protein
MSKKVKTPIMSSDDERFMAFEGLVQWTSGVIAQAERVTYSKKLIADMSPERRRAAIHAGHCETHYFVTAAWKLLEYRKWVPSFGLCSNVDFSEIDKFSESDFRDLRNMREHVVEYFQGMGNDKDRWVIDAPEYKADASTMTGTLIGGRLDWKAFSEAAIRLLPQLLKEPIPFPPRFVRLPPAPTLMEPPK